MARQLTSTGLTVKTQDEIRDDYADDIHGSSEWGEDTSTGPSSAMGQVIDTHAAQEVELDELAQELYDFFNPDNAQGAALDNICAITGIIRNPATYSTVTLTLSGTPSTVIAAGKRARVEDGPIFALDAEATIGGGGTVDADATCDTAGPYEAASGSVDVIVDAVSGWTGVTNAADATVGNAVETDAALRARREESFSRAGNATDAALKADLEALSDVTHATVISNRSLTTDGDGIPGKAFRAVLWPNTADGPTIAETIWDGMPAGIRSDGTQEYTVTDDQGYSQTVRFDWASEQQLYLICDITTDTGYPATGDDLVEASLLAYGNSHTPGQDVKPDYFEGVVLMGYSALALSAIPGIKEIVVKAKIGGWPGAGDTGAVTISLTQIARFDSARITVNS